MTDGKYILDENKVILTNSDDINNRWQQYFNHLRSVENTRETLDEQPPVLGPVQPFTLEELWTQRNKMQNNKAFGPDGVTVEAIRLLMQYGEDLVLQTMNEALINGMPDMWRSSIITQIFKGKGSAMECSNYRGIKLLCYAIKLYERMVENILRKQIEISSNQYGFRPGNLLWNPSLP